MLFAQHLELKRPKHIFIFDLANPCHQIMWSVSPSKTWPPTGKGVSLLAEVTGIAPSSGLACYAHATIRIGASSKAYIPPPIEGAVLSY